MNELKNDNNLREAVGRREQQLPPMPADLNERLMQRIELSRPQVTATATARRPRRLWRYAAVAVAASIALLIIFHFGGKQTAQEPAIAQQTARQSTLSKPLQAPEPVAATPRQEEIKAGAPPARKPARKHRTTVRKLIELIPTAETNPAHTAAAEPYPDSETPSPDYYPTEQDPFVAMAANVEDIRSRGQALQQEITTLMNN